MKRQKLLTYLFSLSSALWVLPSFALPSDSYQLLHVSADSLSINLDTHTATYQGQVNARQGSRNLWGQTLIIQNTAGGTLQSVTALGDPALSQYRAKENAALAQGQAKVIEYLPLENLVRYQKEAELKQAGNIFKGAVIDYNTQTQVVTSPSTNLEQTTIIIPPYNQDSHGAKDTYTTSS